VTSDGARLVARLARPFREFAAAGSLGGLVLVASTIAAVVGHVVVRRAVREAAA
jgi:hypothetical protein